VLTVRAARAVLMAAALLLPTGVRADVMALLPSTRPALDIREVPLGTWAEYRQVRSGGSEIQRFALVGDTDAGRLLEVRVESSSFEKPVLFHFVVSRQPAKGTSSPVDIQIGDDPPLRVLMPDPPPFPDFLSERAKLGTQSTVVEGKRLSVTRYRHEVAGDSWEYWITPKAPPLGFVRSLKQLGGSRSELFLLRVGRGAVANLTGRPVEVQWPAIGQALEKNLRKK
jgi:hypothetical protein